MSRLTGPHDDASLLDLSLYSGIQFADGNAQTTSAANTPLSDHVGAVTQEQLPNPIDAGTF